MIKVTRAVSVDEYPDFVVESESEPDALRVGFGALSALLTPAEARDIAESLYLAADEADGA